MVALTEILSESLEVGVNTKRVRVEYDSLVSEVGSELAVLMDAQVADIASISGDKIAAGVARVRTGDISIEPGYDGRYGTVSVWP